MRRHLLLVAVLASTTRVDGQSPVQNENNAAIQELKPLCAQEEATDRAELHVLRAPASAAVARALTSEAAFWTFLTDPATPYLDRMIAAQHGAGATSVERLPTLWKTAAQLQSARVGVYPSPCTFLRSAQHNPGDWLRRRELFLRGTVSRPESQRIAGRTMTLPIEAVDYPVTLDARASAPWPWQMRRAFSVLMPGVRKYFAEPTRYVLMAETAWRWQPADSNESWERLEALRTGPRNAEWVNIIIRLALQEPRPDSSVLLDLYVRGNDEYHLGELVHAAQIVILQQTDRQDVAANASYQAVQIATTKFASFSKVLKPIRTATATLAIARWAMNANLTERDRYGFASNVCLLVDDPPFRPNPAILNSAAPAFHAEIISSLAAFEKWLSAARPRLEKQADGERARWNAVAAELGRRIE